MISAEQLQEIKARCEATTPGPWCKDSGGMALKVDSRVVELEAKGVEDENTEA